MGDAGVGNLILLIAALLVAGTASALLIGVWGEMASTMEDERNGKMADHLTSISLSGDPLSIQYVAGEITLYLQNSGSLTLDSSSVVVVADGVTLTNSATSVIGGGGWSEGKVLEIDSGDATFTPNSGDEVNIIVFVMSDSGYAGHLGNAHFTEVIRIA